MLPSRIGGASALRRAAMASRRLPCTQARTFLPESLNAKRVLDEKYPDPKVLTDAVDPGQVSTPAGGEVWVS
jgi:hypothetical protein